jgi:hypothetical protein
LSARRTERSRKRRLPEESPPIPHKSANPIPSVSQTVRPDSPDVSSDVNPLSSVWALRRLVVILVLSSGLLVGLTMPGHQVRFAWVAAYLPMFLGLDLTLRSGGRRLVRVLKTLACTWPVGAMLALITGGWVVNTSYVFGGLPLPVAWLVNVFGYGTLMGLEIFVFLGVPYLLTRSRFLL